MKTGVSFKIDQSDDLFLKKILAGINNKEYVWNYIDEQSEVHDISRSKDYFEQSKYSNDSFELKLNEPSFIVFLKLQAYNANDDNKFKNINSFEEYWASTCQMIILVYDCEFVEIYAKNQEVIEKIFTNAKTNEYENISYITTKNNERYKMNIL